VSVTDVLNPAALMHPQAFLSPLAIDDAVTRALAEDLGRAGDVTSIATIPANTQAFAKMVARQAGVIAGLPMFASRPTLTTASASPRACMC
jgi:nicotinate-nucleotide pyrophosphorylase (carboxylating)